MIFKALQLSMILAALSGDGSAEGWFPVEKREVARPAAESPASSGGVYFGKRMGEEKFLVRFLSDPTYHYLDVTGEEMEVGVAVHGVEQRLQILPLWKVPFRAEWQGREEGSGAWIYETQRMTATHHYVFQTKTPVEGEAVHRQFADSMDIVS